jgi:hypothetical protein
MNWASHDRHPAATNHHLPYGGFFMSSARFKKALFYIKPQIKTKLKGGISWNFLTAQ